MTRVARRVTGAVVLVLGALAGSAPAQEQFPATDVCPDERSRQFDFWLGDWDVRNLHRQPGSDDPRWYSTGTSVSRVEPVIGGCALVEQWYGELSFDRIRGASLRAFNPTADEWDIVILWPSPDRPTFGTLEGEFRHGRGEFFTEGVDQHDRQLLTRFTFADIRPDMLRWDAAQSGDSGITWRTTWIMEFTRHVPGDSLIRPAWVDTLPRCGFPAMVEFEFAIGAWDGTATLADGRTVPATLRSDYTLGGCAVEERLQVGAGVWEAYEIRTFDQGVRSWVAFRVDTSHPVLQRLEGPVRGADAQLLGSRHEGDDEVLVAERWEWVNAGLLRYDLRESGDGGATWTAVIEAELAPTGGT